MTRLAGLAAIDKTSCGRAIEKLAGKNMVRIAFDPNDRRQRYPSLTADGVAALRGTWPGVRRIRGRLLEGLDPESHDQFLALLRSFVEIKNDESRAPHRDL